MSFLYDGVSRFEIHYRHLENEMEDDSWKTSIAVIWFFFTNFLIKLKTLTPQFANKLANDKVLNAIFVAFPTAAPLRVTAVKAAVAPKAPYAYHTYGSI